MDTIEVLIVGAGPAGLRAAQVLADAGREVVVAEKRAEIGPKACAGGLTLKTIDLLRRLGLPDQLGLERVGQVAFDGRCCVLHPERTLIRTVSRRELGGYQLRWARAAGADVRPGSPVTSLDLAGRAASVGGQAVRWRHLIGADGADSGVRRALRVPSPRECFAAEYNVRRPQARALAGGGGSRSRRRIFLGLSPLRLHLDRCRRIQAHGAAVGAAPVSRPPCRGARRAARGRRRSRRPRSKWSFAGSIFPATCISPAMPRASPPRSPRKGSTPPCSPAKRWLDASCRPAYQAERTRRWLGVKRRHDRLERALQFAPARAAVFPALARVARWRPARRTLADWFLAG